MFALFRPSIQRRDVRSPAGWLERLVSPPSYGVCVCVTVSFMYVASSVLRIHADTLLQKGNYL